jgi:PAS domain S-box-containing protein
MDKYEASPARILIIDDEPMVYFIINKILLAEGYHTEYADSGEAAFKILGRGDTDLILLDIIMPVMNGFEVCKKLQENPSTSMIPVVFVTGVEDQKSYIKGFEVGAIDYLYKPIHKTDLIIKIRNYLRLSRYEAELKRSELRYKSIVEDQTEFIFRCLPDGNITFVNQSFCSFLEKTNKDLIGKNISDVLICTGRKEILKELHSLTISNPVMTRLRALCSSDGKMVSQQWADRALFDPASRLVEYQGVGRDVSVQKRYEESVRAITDKTAGKSGKDFYNVLVKELAKIISADFALIGTPSDEDISVINTLAICHKDKILKNLSLKINCESFETYFGNKNQKTKNCFSGPCRENFVLNCTPIKVIAGIPLYDKFENQIGVLFALGNEHFEMSDNKFDIIKIFSIRVAEELEHEISERKLLESEQKFRNIFQSSIDGIVISDLSYNVLDMNRAFIKTFSLVPDENKQKKLTDFVLKSDIPKLSSWLSVLKDTHSINPLEIRGILPGRKIITLEINSIVIDYGGNDAILSILRDITDRKEVHQKILNTVIETEEKERQRFAQDLHDGMGPLLSTIKLYTRSILTAKDDKNKAEALEKSLETIDEAISSIKEIANNISPHILKNFGLVSAVDSYVKKFTVTKKLSISFNSEVSVRFDPNFETSVFRIIIELINNTSKHAFADNVMINLNFSDGLLSLIYLDDGIGFDYKHVTEELTGHGLTNITNRVKSLDGDLIIETALNKGFSVKINITVSKDLIIQ